MRRGRHLPPHHPRPRLQEPAGPPAHPLPHRLGRPRHPRVRERSLVHRTADQTALTCHQLVFEVVGRAVNEALTTGAGSVDVTLTSDRGVRVTDDGPGVPFEARASGDSGGPGLEALLTSLYAGSEPGGRHIATVGHAGVGPFVASALSSLMTAEVRCEGVRWVQEYARCRSRPALGRGARDRTRDDHRLLARHRDLRDDALLVRRAGGAFPAAGLPQPGPGDLAGRRRPVRRNPGGTVPGSGRVRDFVAALDAEAGATLHPDVIGFEQEDPRMAGTMEVALLWSGSRGERIRGFANSRPTPEGGTHVDGFRAVREARPARIPRRHARATGQHRRAGLCPGSRPGAPRQLVRGAPGAGHGGPRPDRQ
ncbi:hypothetical protein EJ357_14265 [Streptomyces cyaneochromogenes]|uniref:DNA topoisomerase (ATP-hydrolyzing) n=1 Tax=Streptomyces cyaneochromogenes TaxID=2496836 RepID=A0A3S9MMH5_9ACTN|nr:hypothetical protein EJ357_14265 [Streptomyces cyaneochromogenes]